MWNRIDASSRAGEDQDSLSIGCPLGWPQVNGWIPIESVCQTSDWSAEPSASSPVGFLSFTPITRYVATTSSPGSRTFLPWACWKEGEATRARSTGTIAVSFWR